MHTFVVVLFCPVKQLNFFMYFVVVVVVASSSSSSSSSSIGSSSSNVPVLHGFMCIMKMGL